MVTERRPPFISLEDRERARAAAKAQKLTYGLALAPAISLLLSCLAILMSVNTAYETGVAQRAELLRLLDAEMRDAIPDALKAQISRHEPFNLNPYDDIQRRLNAPLSALRIWQPEVEAMREDVAWRHAIDKETLEDDKARAQLDKDIKDAADREKAEQSRLTAPTTNALSHGPQLKVNVHARDSK
jgi:hypothetical protein